MDVIKNLQDRLAEAQDEARKIERIPHELRHEDEERQWWKWQERIRQTQFLLADATILANHGGRNGGRDG